MDPLEVLPAEIVLRILDFAPISTLGNLTQATRAWHDFIDKTHQDNIYASHRKTQHPEGVHDLSFLSNNQSFAKYFDRVSSWKDLCKRQTLLSRAWSDKQPTTRESVIQVGNDAIWRFRADFQRRFFLSTSQQGGMNVTDMDTGHLLWRLTSDQVRPFAHLEYQDGVAVWDREGDAVEVWKTDQEGLSRGEFQRTAILPHNCQTRGFQLSYDLLCVVSTQGYGFVYDMKQDPPQLTSHLEIERDAVGHLDQNEEVVMICMGKKGYHFHDKFTGTRKGIFDPKKCKVLYHIHHPSQPANSIVSTGNAFDSLPSVEIFPPRQPNTERLTPLTIDAGPVLRVENENYIDLGDDEWGAALFSGPLMVGISKGGRVLVCPDWKAGLEDPRIFESNSYIIECESDTSSFDLGGWLSVRDKRILVEIQDRIYVISLRPDGTLQTTEADSQRPSFSFTISSATQLAVPVSFMALFDDSIMATYTTLGWRRRTQATDAEDQQQNRFRIFPTKTIRILSLAPELEPDSKIERAPLDAHEVRMTDEDRQASILEIMDMLSEEEDADDSDEDQFYGE